LTVSLLTSWQFSKRKTLCRVACGSHVILGSSVEASNATFVHSVSLRKMNSFFPSSFRRLACMNSRMPDARGVWKGTLSWKIWFFWIVRVTGSLGVFGLARPEYGLFVLTSKESIL
jgi:hypothetical protein